MSRSLIQANLSCVKAQNGKILTETVAIYIENPYIIAVFLQVLRVENIVAMERSKKKSIGKNS